MSDNRGILLLKYKNYGGDLSATIPGNVRSAVLLYYSDKLKKDREMKSNTYHFCNKALNLKCMGSLVNSTKGQHYMLMFSATLTINGTDRYWIIVSNYH